MHKCLKKTTLMIILWSLMYVNYLAPVTDQKKPAVWAATPREAGWIFLASRHVYLALGLGSWQIGEARVRCCVAQVCNLVLNPVWAPPKGTLKWFSFQNALYITGRTVPKPLPLFLSKDKPQSSSHPRPQVRPPLHLLRRAPSCAVTCCDSPTFCLI